MKRTGSRNPFIKYFLVLICGLMALPPVLVAAESADDQAPGRKMAHQAIKEMHLWNTTDHSKHAVLQQDFKSGAEITKACISCHSEAETQFHKTIHWTWLAEPDEKEKQYGKAGNSMNNFCIGTNKTDDRSCLACHPGWGTSTETLP